MNTTKIAVLDKDANNAVLGIITLYYRNRKQFDKLFNEYKGLKEGVWSWEGFLNFLTQKNILFKWESGNVSQLEI